MGAADYLKSVEQVINGKMNKKLLQKTLNYYFIYAVINFNLGWTNGFILYLTFYMKMMLMRIYML